MKTVDELLLDHQEFHSDLQMDSFITLRSGGTVYGCFKQALRELTVRATGVRDREAARELLLIDIDELETQPVTGFEKRRNEVKLRQKRQQLTDSDRILADVLRELERFHQQADTLRAALEENGVTFPLDTRTRHRLDFEMWEHNLKARCAVELMATGGIGTSTIELIQSCPAAMRSRVVERVQENNRRALIAWFMEQDQGLLTCSELSDSPKRLPHTSQTDALTSPASNYRNGSRSASHVNSETECSAGTSAADVSCR